MLIYLFQKVLKGIVAFISYIILLNSFVNKLRMDLGNIPKRQQSEQIADNRFVNLFYWGKTRPFVNCVLFVLEMFGCQ